MIESAFTCTGPYAMLIFSGVKCVENRAVMPIPSSGRCAISVSRKFSCAEYGRFMDWALEKFGMAWCMSNLWDWEEVSTWRGCIVGAADYDAVQTMPKMGELRVECEIWNEGYAAWWFLTKLRMFTHPIPCCGNVGMWQLNEDLRRRVELADVERK